MLTGGAGGGLPRGPLGGRRGGWAKDMNLSKLLDTVKDGSLRAAGHRIMESDTTQHLKSKQQSDWYWCRSIFTFIIT